MGGGSSRELLILTNKGETMNKKLIKQLNEYYGCEYIVDGSANEKKDKPMPGKTYALTGARGSRCIANGNSWAESEVKDPAAQEKDMMS